MPLPKRSSRLDRHKPHHLTTNWSWVHFLTWLDTSAVTWGGLGQIPSKTSASLNIGFLFFIRHFIQGSWCLPTYHLKVCLACQHRCVIPATTHRTREIQVQGLPGYSECTSTWVTFTDPAQWQNTCKVVGLVPSTANEVHRLHIVYTTQTSIAWKKSVILLKFKVEF